MALVAPLVQTEPIVKKGRHRRFEEARRLKQSGPTAEDLGLSSEKSTKSEEDEFAEIAERYGVVFDDDGEIADNDEGSHS
ncbi:hypothetical protein LBMAG03_12720 [Actinomycetes bacterium]|jgi:hypothetical protein|nr:hypothetical protein LBMAG03_12720 [Actinomycetes bacterium]